ncbi:MAG: MFS transporter [Opitutales bacterium]|jgi:MFS family permease
MADDTMNARKGVIGSIFFTIFIDLVGFSIIFPLLPAILQWYLPQSAEGSLIGRIEAYLTSISPASGSGSHDVITLVLFGGAIGSIFSILQFVSSPIWGRLSDRFGRRKVLLVTTSCTCVGYVIWLFSGNIWMFILGRITCGLMAGNISVASAAVADVTSGSKRTKGMAIVGIAFATGFMIGPAIGGVASLIDMSAYIRPGFVLGINPFSGAALVSVALSLINLIWIALRFPETLRPELRKRHTISVNPITNFRMDPGPARKVMLVNFAFLVSFSGMEFTLTFLALERLNFGPRDNIAIFVFGGMVMTLVQSVFTHRRSERMSEKTMACIGIAFGLAGMATLAVANGKLLFFSGLFLKASGIALIAPTLSSLVSLYTPPSRQGSVMGSFRAAGSLARAIGPVCAALLYWAIGSRLTYLAGAFVLLGPLYMSYRLPKPDKKPTPMQF